MISVSVAHGNQRAVGQAILVKDELWPRVRYSMNIEG
jgi:hypothetical protein